MSHRSGESEDAFIVDFAVALKLWTNQTEVL